MVSLVFKVPWKELATGSFIYEGCLGPSDLQCKIFNLYFIKSASLQILASKLNIFSLDLNMINY